MEDKAEKVTSAPLLPFLSQRQPDGHKGDYGRVLIVGGSRGMVGAVALASNAALRGGAGLVTFAAPQTVQLTIAGLCPCATSLPLACDESGRLSREALREMTDAAQLCDVLAVGPGMGVGGPQKDLVQAAIQQQKPLILDADGLNNLAKIVNWSSMLRCPAVLTPHPGEFARLTGRSVGEIQAARESSAVAAARRWNQAAPDDAQLVCVLKGASTVVTDGQRVFVNETGNPGMATGGSGDVLTGLTAAMVGQGMSPFESACLAVHVHGLAGDLAAEELGQASMIASDLLDFLPAAMQNVSQQ